MPLYPHIHVHDLYTVLHTYIHVHMYIHTCMHTCTHTHHIQVVSALSSCRPIVTPVWLEQAVTCWREGRVLPSCAAFEPEVSDSNIGSGSKEVSFQPDFKRSSLLQDKVFYFLTKKQVLGCLTIPFCTFI